LRPITVSSSYTYLDGTEYPQYQRLEDCQSRGSDTNGKVDADVFPNFWICTSFRIPFGPVLQPNTAAYVVDQSAIFADRGMGYAKNAEEASTAASLGIVSEPESIPELACRD
jgi:hypothetical protein